MLIRRCAWHREVHGYTVLHGIASWRGLSVRFTDGVCRRCAARVRVEWHLGRAPSASPLQLASFVFTRYRYGGLVAGLALLAVVVLPVFGPAVPERPAPTLPVAQVATTIAAPAAVPAGVAAPSSTEVPPPRVSRHRPLAPPDVVVVRYRAPRPPVLTATRWNPAAPAAPVETKPIDVARPVPVAAAPPMVSSISRARATEDELMRTARRHSTARLLLTPPEDRPRHAGLVVQTP